MYRIKKIIHFFSEIIIENLKNNFKKSYNICIGFSSSISSIAGLLLKEGRGEGRGPVSEKTILGLKIISMLITKINFFS